MVDVTYMSSWTELDGLFHAQLEIVKSQFFVMSSRNAAIYLYYIHFLSGQRHRVAPWETSI